MFNRGLNKVEYTKSNRIAVFLTVLFLAFVTVSCNMRDDFMEKCYKPYLIIVEIDYEDERQSDFSEYKENDITLMREVRDVILYVFDGNDRYLGYQLTKLNTVTPLPYEGYDSIRVVSVCIDRDINGWANMLTVGNKYKEEDLFLQLENKSLRDTVSVVNSPVDFMFDAKRFEINPYNDKNVIYYMYARSMVGAMKICTNNMAEWADVRYGVTGKEKDEFTFVVGQTFDKYNFQGKLYGDYVEYSPEYEVLSDSLKGINTRMFNMYPTMLKSGVQIEIYRNDELIYPYMKSSRKYAFTINPGWCMKVLINFDPAGGINIDVENWNNVDIKVDL